MGLDILRVEPGSGDQRPSGNWADRWMRLPRSRVARSAAAALGNIGPDAAGALPELQRALTIYRVKNTAQEAILKIKKEPVPAWF